MPTIDGTTPEHITRWARAYEAVKVAAGKKRPTSGMIPCPNCQGQLVYSVAANGHTWGRCSTDDCAKWIE